MLYGTSTLPPSASDRTLLEDVEEPENENPEEIDETKGEDNEIEDEDEE